MSYDLIVLGSGPGGYPAAIRAAQYGLKVGVVEKDAKLGGTCLHVGCVPTKAYLHFADVYDHVEHSEEIGISHGEVKVDFAKMLAKKNQIIDKHSKGLVFLFKKHKIDLIQGYGRLSGGTTVEVTAADGTKVTHEAKAVVLASGSSARMLPGLEPDPDVILTNIEILSQADIPKSLAIIGAGAVGVEFASIYRTFGTEVNVIEMLPRLVPVEDEDISAELARAFKKRGIGVHLDTKVDKIVKQDGGVKLTLIGADGESQTVEAEKLLVAVGRKPNTEDVGLDKTSIETDRGFVKTNEWMETAQKGVYAVGDIVAGTAQLAHLASMEGLVAAARIAGKPVEPINYLQNPGATYCEPQIGSVGLTEASAREQGHQVKIGKFNFGANSKASVLGVHSGFVKVIADEDHGEILGVHIIGPNATDLISEAVLAMSAEATVETIMTTIHAHPTLPEAVQDAFAAVYGLSING